MDANTFKSLAIAIVVGFGVLGPGLGIGMIGAGALKALGQNPQAESKIRTLMILAIAFAEALAIFAVLFGFIIYSSK
jgi:F-type H+-transporting ATPase subunit c